MYALVDFSGTQIKIEEGKSVKIPFQNKSIGTKINLDNVLFYDDGKTKKIGSPYIKSLSFQAKIIAHDKEDKIIVYKKKRRKGYEKKIGHKQVFSTIKVDKLSVSKKKSPVKKATKSSTTKKTTKAKKK